MGMRRALAGMEVNGLNMALLYSFRRRCRCTPAVIYSHVPVVVFCMEMPASGVPALGNSGNARWVATARALVRASKTLLQCG